eukprot:3830876-Alexandrium_andersonii.AAC.1
MAMMMMTNPGSSDLPMCRCTGSKILRVTFCLLFRSLAPSHALAKPPPHSARRRRPPTGQPRA